MLESSGLTWPGVVIVLLRRDERDERDDCLAKYAPLARSAKLVTRNTQ